MMNKQMPRGFRCVLVGGESLLVQCAQSLMQRGHQVVAVVTTRSAIRNFAIEQGIRVIKDTKGLLQATDLAPFDYLFSITNLAVLSDQVLALPTRGAINFHDGPLPTYGGLNTPVWALLHGVTRYGITWHRMTSQVDRGDILVQRHFDVDAHDTALTLNTKNYGAAIEAFETLIDGLADGSLSGLPQKEPIRHYFGRSHRPPGMAMIDWQVGADAVLRLVRALDFGSYANPVASAKASMKGDPLRIVQAARGEPTAAPPGTVVAVEAGGIHVAANDASVILQRFETLDGQALDATHVAARWSLGSAGSRLDVIDKETVQRLSAINERVAAHEGFWLRRLENRTEYELVTADRKAALTGHISSYVATHPWLQVRCGKAGLSAVDVAAGFVALLARLADRDSFDIGLSTPELEALREGDLGLMSPQSPLSVRVDFASDVRTWKEAFQAEWQLVHERGTFALDAIGRHPELRKKGQAAAKHAVALAFVNDLDTVDPSLGRELTVAFHLPTGRSRWMSDSALLSEQAVRAMQAQLDALMTEALRAPQTTVAKLPLMDAATTQRVTVDWNRTAVPVRSDVAVHHLIEAQATRTPDAVAITANGESITYGELNRRANRWARRLHALGVKPDTLVGLMCERSVAMMVGLLAIHKAGGAYVPLDPTYPRERLAHMIEDARAPVILTLEHLRDELPPTSAQVLALDAEVAQVESESDAAFDGGGLPENLAYVIYTSGSTGKPKGVMVEHRNVVNFFAGMDAHLGGDLQAGKPLTWLAVTSLSFDISVLELCWTLTKGFHVVISSDEDRSAAAGMARGPATDRPLDFSLFYFSSDESEGVSDKYKLLMEGARYADEHGFAAVWTPERHFNAFGGLYPNPAVTGAAVAAVTKNVQIRAGSVVLPLHHPLRVAEEWSVVDNLSNGRVGISFASGWHPNDFVLKPENYADNKKIMLRDIEVVQSLWRGHAHAFDGPLGKPVEVKVLPRPVQKELPFWVTSAGNPETFAAAGRLGANVLTHLLGQTVEELGAKLAAYRKAWSDAGHAGQGYVSLMLHTFVGPDEAKVREKVRQPLIEYLRSSANLVKQYAWAFPAFKRPEGTNATAEAVDLSTVSKEDMDALLEFSFERYYETSGLFGTPDSCLKMIDAIKAIGVDDVACLIDFGVDSATVLEHLPFLNELRQRGKPRRAKTGAVPLATLLATHSPTHLQCTPSMARMLLLDDAAKPHLAKLDRMMVGGEALQPALAKELMSIIRGRLMNMYGPTETTVWSAVHTLDPSHEGPIPLGRPLANQSIHILDRRQQPMPVGVPGELVIGGAGVVRGYLHRPELTAEKFLAHPLPGGQGRVYRTGDLARWREDGTVEFLGRLDHQVKVRGYRIELGEIEALIAKQPRVSETVVVSREDTPGDVRLVAYVVPKPGASVDEAAMREALRAELPSFMVPAHFVVLPALPQTPNGKIDRKQLPAPDVRGVDAAQGARDAAFVAPSDELELKIAQVWKDQLKLASIGVRDNFFDLGGHSLLAIQVLRELKVKLQRDIAITDLFRFPTVQALANHLGHGSAEGIAAKEGQDRAKGRRAAMSRRSGARESTTTT